MSAPYELSDDSVVVIIGTGAGGGTLVAAGPPEDIARVPASHTGRYLARAFD